LSNRQPHPQDFPIENLPYGVFSVGDGPWRVGVAIGDKVVDLTEFAPVFGAGSLDALIEAGYEAWEMTRGDVSEFVSSHKPEQIPMDFVEMHMPFHINDYVDFYSSIHHATNVGRLLRPGTDPLTPNWRHMPIGYHGRAGTVVIDSTPIKRPSGQMLGPDGPVFGPTRKLDFELEIGFVTGQGPKLGTPVSVTDAERYIFGLVLVNDWSARDIQAWEYQPLGPFLGKSFATTISPWVVPLAALVGSRVDPPIQDPPPLPYLTPPGNGLDVNLEASINGRVVTRSNTTHLYWTMSQQLAYATSNGATFGPGDLFASGTVSGPTPDSLGCLLEITGNGQSGEYLRDGHIVTLTAWAGGRTSPRIGFGLCSGRVVP
jgi:fumarylacetoacetase